MTETRLSALAVVAVVCVAVVSGGTTYALLSDTESVAVSVSVDTVPPESETSGSGDDQAAVGLRSCGAVDTVTHDGSGSPGPNGTVDAAPDGNTTTSANGTESAVSPCPKTQTDGPRPLGSPTENATNATSGNQTQPSGNESTPTSNETVAGSDEDVTSSNTNESVAGDDENETSSSTNETGDDGDTETTSEDDGSTGTDGTTTDDTGSDDGTETEAESADETDSGG